ncbi:HAD hydrolase-like protein [Sphingorhabdus contaminans]|uniref:phosphoglycolate phosphatase n=1 Tax=Sphingorhabdus contaminans TaxID=1343899 RepID=A0A553W985_9SPHN|nr:HAD hydrolase-like protein [Sphingorhabdus contaminans]TSB01258.1 HAD family hydrolase [Sphingorhabdus contaminans]
MTQIPFDIIGFDLDGTLVDTSGDLTAAVNHVLETVGRPLLSTETVKQHIGGGAKLMLQQGLEATGGIPGDDFRPLYRQMLGYYEANVSVHSRPFDGALDVLDQLDAVGVRYAVVTNKFESLAVKLLTDLGLAHRMVCILGADTLGKENAKPSGAPIFEMVKRGQALGSGGRAAYIGDSIYDVMAAKNANVPSIAVSFGFLHGPVEEMGADAVIDHFDELLPTLRNLG